MNKVISALLLVWLVLAVVGATVQGFFWLAVIALALILGTGALAEAVHPPGDDGPTTAARGRRSPSAAILS